MTVKVLVVDDSALMRKLFSQLFVNNGYRVETARDGEEALEKVMPFAPDIITMDINMPRMDGITCLSLIKKVHDCPVLMLSSLTAKGALITLEALALGATDFVLKPGGTVTTDISSIERELVDKIDSITASRSLQSVKPKPTPKVTPVSSPASKAGIGKPPSGKYQCVFIGVSTGGPKKLEQILSALPAEFPCPILVAQHMPKGFTQALARRLDGLSKLRIVEVSERMKMEKGAVYIARGDSDVQIQNMQGTLFARPVPASNKFLWHPSVDRMIDSAMNCLKGPDMLCIQLTGMGNDGVQAMSKAYQAGATVIAESKQTATVYGMPKELIDTGCTHFIVNDFDIANKLVTLCKV